MFFGCWGQLGHYLWLPIGKTAVLSLPWQNIDGALTPGKRPWLRYNDHTVPSEEQIEGLAQLHHRSEWTALAWWDRSVDKRHGSNAVIFAKGTFTFDQMLVIGREHFPSVFARFTYEIREAGKS